MVRLLSAVVALLLAACSTAPTAPVVPQRDPATMRTISTGGLEGYVAASNGAHVWRAIPFAAPPVGALRWRAPRPPAHWEGVRAANTPSPWCTQVLSALDGVPKQRWGELAGQEDCLYLDVYAPPMTADVARTSKLPVMMWIHGGSNTWGRAAQYDGSVLAARHNVIVVIVQYRLGPMGWFAHDSIRSGGTLPEDASPNFANLDHIRALEWIRDEIGAFGGDAGRVTIFGESAGGHDVAGLLVSPRAKGLFHRAIVQSGSFRTVSMAEAEGLEGNRADSGGAVATKLMHGAPVTGDALRAVPLKDLYGAYDTSRAGFDPPRMIADGIVLPATGIAPVLDQPATFNAVPVILGTNRDEMKLFNALDPRLVTQVLGRFPQPRDKAFYEAASTYPTQIWRVAAVNTPAQRMTSGGHPAVWTYRFDWDEEGRVFVTHLDELLGAGHSLEIPFVFGHFKLLGAFDRFAFTKENAPGRLALSDAMMSYWANFAATGDPGRGVKGDLPAWTPWSNAAGAPNAMLFDTPKSGGPRMSAEHLGAEDVFRGLFQDPVLATPVRQCAVYTATIRFNPELAGAEKARCP
jgi:para-nitrobenzyl esterase